MISLNKKKFSFTFEIPQKKRDDDDDNKGIKVMTEKRQMMIKFFPQIRNFIDSLITNLVITLNFNFTKLPAAFYC